MPRCSVCVCVWTGLSEEYSDTQNGQNEAKSAPELHLSLPQACVPASPAQDGLTFS